MPKRFLVVVMLVMLVAAPVRGAEDAEMAVAARLSDFGTDLLRQQHATAAHYRACIAILKAAHKLDPDEARYPRLLVEASLAIGDVDGAIASLKRYRDIMPDDLGAQIQLIQLQLSKMETLDAKLAYANQILAADRVSGDVRSAVAVTAARVYFERAQVSHATQMLDQAIRLNPRNAEALLLRYQQGADMSEFQRVKLLLEMIKTNPLQPQAVGELATRLAQFGLVKPSLEWYFQAMRLYQRVGQLVPLELAVDYGAEQFLADRYDGADGMAIRLLQGDKFNIDAVYLRLLCARNTVALEDDRSSRNLARRTLLRQLADVNDFVLNPTTRPSTAPADQAGEDEDKVTYDPVTGLPIPKRLAEVDLLVEKLPDLSAAIAKVQPMPGNSPERFELASAIGDLLWYVVYFDYKPDVAESLLASLAKIVPADDLMLVRLQGWHLLMQNKPEAAKVKLDALADRDPLAVVGLIKLTDPTDPEANNRGRKLLADHPAGMIGAFIKESLRDRGIKVVAREQGQVLVEALNQFPMRWMEIIDAPSDFYAILGEPLVGQFDYRQPMLVRITLQNLSPFDIPLGPGGVVRNDLWIDAQVRGAATQEFPGTAYDRISRQLVLRPRQSVSQVVRVDQGPLAKLLAENPTQPHQIMLRVTTNPIATQEGMVAGVGGYTVQLKKLVAREGFAISSDRAVDNMLENLTAGQKGRIAHMDLMAAYIEQGRQNKGNERLEKVVPRFEEKLVAVKVDPSPTVRAWAAYVLAGLAPAQAKGQRVQELSRSVDWQARLLAGLRSNELGPESRKAVLTELSHDAEPVVKEYAAAMLETIAGPSTAPTTAPTTQP